MQEQGSEQTELHQAVAQRSLRGCHRLVEQHERSAPLEWQKGFNLIGLSVALVGSAASAIQILPAIAPRVARVVVVNPTQFRLIRQSVKKSDPHDARTLAFYLSKGMLPEVRMKEKLPAQLASLA